MVTQDSFRGFSQNKSKLVKSLKLKSSNTVPTERDGRAMAAKLNAMSRVAEDDLSQDDTTSIVWESVRGGRRARFGRGYLVKTIAGGITYVADANN